MTSELKLIQNPKSLFSESIKTIRTNIEFSTVGKKKLKTILLTSPESGDGKSLLAASLALAFAQEKKKVLLIDCDLRKGRQHQIFDLDNSIGYSNMIFYYKDDAPFANFIKKTGLNRVDLITSGKIPSNPIELLGSDNNKNLIADLKKSYDIIIFDCPPVLGLSDALVMSKYSDANIIVVSSKKTKIELLDRAKKAFEQSKAKITGVVLNKVSAKEKSYYGYYEHYGKE